MIYNVLNGDSLREIFPPSIPGELIVARECLIEGDLRGDNLEEFFRTRSDFISREYNTDPKEYGEGTFSEFNKILNTPADYELNLWFEDDLFCQTNLWFVCHLINTGSALQVFLIRPEDDLLYGFGGMDQEALVRAHESRIAIDKTNLKRFDALWLAYKKNDLTTMSSISNELKEVFPFVEKAVEAHIERHPVDGSLPRPQKALKEIMNELQTREFIPVFHAFHKRESIYGFGDLQVKKMMDKMLEEMP